MAAPTRPKAPIEEDAAAQPLEHQHLQQEVQEANRQQYSCHVRQHSQHRQHEQQDPEKRKGGFRVLGVADGRAREGLRVSPSSEEHPTPAATVSLDTSATRTGSKLLFPLSMSASSSSRKVDRGLSVYGLQISASPAPPSAGAPAKAAALKLGQKPSADTDEAARGSRRGKGITGRWFCCTLLRKVCCGGLQYLEHLKARSLDAIMYGFEKYAALVYKYSWTFLILSVLLTAALSVGVFQRTIERNVYKLYSLKVSPSQKTKEKLVSAFPPDRVLQIIVESKNRDMLQQQALQQLAELQAAVQRLTLERDSVKVDEYNCKLDKNFDRSKYPAILTYQDICAVDAQNQCVSASVLDLYPDAASYGHLPLLLESQDNPTIINPSTGRIFLIDSIIADYELEPVAPGRPEQRVVNARVALLRMNLRGDEEWRPFVAAYEELVIQYLLHRRTFTPDMYLTPRTDRSAADELHHASTLDLPHWLMLVGAGVLVTIYTSVVNSSLTYRTKLLPSAMGALASLLGYLGGAGAVYLCGVYHTAPADATPFLALGIGVDDLFVIINAYSLTYLYKDPQQRVVSALRDAGLSITLTTLTNVITFMIGAVCPYYSISGFCLVTSGALCWGYVMCLTFFLAVLCIDARREARKQTLLHALVCSNTPCRNNRVTVSDRIPEVAAGGAPVIPAVSLPEKDGETAAVSGERAAAEDGVLRKTMEKEDDDEAIGGARKDVSPVSVEGLREAAEKAEITRRVVTKSVGVTLPREAPHQVIEAGNACDLESSPVSCYGEELLTIHELAALMVLYQKRKRLRSVQGASLTQAGGHLDENIKKSTGYMSILHRDVQSSSTACEVTPHSSNKDRKSPQESSKCPWQYKDEATSESERVASPEEDKRSNTTSRGARHTDTQWGEARRSLLNATLFTPSSSWHAGEGNAHSAMPSNSRPNVEETAHLLKHFQQELEENPDRLLILYHPEPRGNPGRIWRLFFREYYARLLGSTWVKMLILLVFLTLAGLSIYGSTLLEYGFALKDITPNASFLRDFYEMHEKYFSKYGDEVVIFFPGTVQLENRSVQREYLKVVNGIKNTDKISAVGDGLSLFLDRAINQLPDGNRPQFLFACVVFCDVVLLYCNTLSCGRLYCLFAKQVSLLLIPNLASAALVVAAVTFVDLCLFGLMGFIHLHLSMISMVTLLISVGYSVDFTIHVAHTFTHCVGSSLQDRISETMVVMGAPVTHGMISTLLAVMALSGSPRYILQVFFKMMLMVVTLSYAAGMILLPTVLTLIGPTGRHRRRRAALNNSHIPQAGPSLSM